MLDADYLIRGWVGNTPQPKTEWLNRKQPGINKKDKQMETNEVDEAIKKGPRLCWVWNAGRGAPYPAVIGRVQKVHNWKQYIDIEGRGWENAELVKREEIEKYLGDK